MDKKIDVVIPSATIVPEELQNMGRLPAVIYPIGDKIVFDYLFDKYNDIVHNMDILCFQEKEKVHSKLKKIKKVNLIDIDYLDDLGHTIYSGLKGKNNPVFINFADTIILDQVDAIENDSIFYFENYISDTWTYFDGNDGKISHIYDKQKPEKNEKKKLFVGLFYIKNPQMFCESLEEAFAIKNRNMSTFYYGLYLYSKKAHFEFVKVNKWLDIGHADTYSNSNIEVKAREFNHITIDKERGLLKKVSDDKDKFIGEILWYLKLPNDIEYVRPRIFSYSTSYNNPYVIMEFYSYHTVHELFLYSDLKYQQWVDIFNRIKFVCNDLKRYTIKDEKIISSLEDMYLTKTIQRFEKLKNDERFVSFFNKNITVNAVKYLNLNRIVEILEKIIPSMLYDVEQFSIIHGDLCFANIMIDEKLSFVKVIDPRGKFGSFDIYGDFRYELAKLFHSVDGKYDYIIKDLFILDYNLNNNCIKYAINDRDLSFDLYQMVIEVFKDEIANDLKKIELIEALLFLSMIPLHNESFDHQLVMLSTGLQILDRVVNIKVED